MFWYISLLKVSSAVTQSILCGFCTWLPF